MLILHVNHNIAMLIFFLIMCYLFAQFYLILIKIAHNKLYDTCMYKATQATKIAELEGKFI